MKVVSRREAKRLGLKRYFTGKRCKHGHVAERNPCDGKCVECKRRRFRLWYVANREKRCARSRVWNLANPDRQAAHNGLWRAQQRYPGCVPADFDFEATVPFYAEARRLTRTTGVLHVVDHIHALCLGGKHHHRNLQVITWKENDRKAKAEQATAQRR